MSLPAIEDMMDYYHYGMLARSADIETGEIFRIDVPKSRTLQ
jgi:hypothetical protein